MPVILHRKVQGSFRENIYLEEDTARFCKLLRQLFQHLLIKS